MRLIDADALMDKRERVESFDEGGWGRELFAVDVEEIGKAATVDPVKHGRWDMSTKIVERYGFFLEGKYPTCSECGYTTVEFCMGFNYCPDCGAKMEAEQ